MPICIFPIFPNLYFLKYKKDEHKNYFSVIFVSVRNKNTHANSSPIIPNIPSVKWGLLKDATNERNFKIYL